MNLHTALDISILAATIVSQLWWLYQWIGAQRTIRQLREQLKAKGGSNQHLHNAIGNIVGEAKKRMFDALSLGAELELAISNFIADLTRELAEIVKGEPRSGRDVHKVAK